MAWHFTLSGAAPPASRVEVLDESGDVIATATTGAAGQWSTTARLAAGEHQIHAIADGESSPTIAVTVDADDHDDEYAGESTLTAAELIELAEQQQEIDALRAEAVERYGELVHAVVDGFEVDHRLAETAIAAAGKSLSDFASDVSILSSARSHARLLEASRRLKLDAAGRQD